MKFAKSFDTPNSIPQQGIENAVNLMENGMLYRYGHVDSNAIPSEKDSEFSGESEVSKLEHAFGQYTGHKYVVAVNSCGSAMFIGLKAMAFSQVTRYSLMHSPLPRFPAALFMLMLFRYLLNVMINM